MSCIVNSVCKLCRRENMKLFLKGDRCYSDKCSFERRPYPPGQHGQRRLKFSEFALQLREKQKVRRWYGVSEKQFFLTLSRASRSKGLTGETLLQLLETRLDNVVYSLGFASSRREARQLVKHNGVLLNGKRCNIPSVTLNKGDVVQLVDSAKAQARVQAAIQSVARRSIPAWLEADHAAFKGTVKDLPKRDEVTVPTEENMIVEYYSR
ncbi:MAG: 30S ribosomal protein S4 [Bdellovibrionaceae bacterium]|nr:30S ribosomal protein S4 [Pseudobdellovibrionaceae bacterium]